MTDNERDRDEVDDLTPDQVVDRALGRTSDVDDILDQALGR
ncbi:hypothetical protein [Microbacterium sp.]|nr:hypothetical protein [Microbacterium sp.]